MLGSRGFNMQGRWIWPAALALLTLCAFALRWYYVSTAMVIHPVRGDATQYYAYAWNLLHHGIFSKSPPDSLIVVADNYRDPGYPVFLAIWMKLLGTGSSWYAAVLLSQALLGALTVTLVTQLGRHWLPAGWCLGAGALMAIWPHSVTSSSFLLTETLVGFLCAVAMLATAHAHRFTSTISAAFAGLTFGVAALTNAVLLPFGLLLAGVLMWRRLAPSRMCIALVLGALLLPALWAVRNAQIPPVAADNANGSSMDRAIQTLVVGAWPDFHRAWAAALIHGDPAAQSTLDAVTAETRLLEQSPAAGTRALLHRLSEHPVRYLVWYTLEKPRLLWGWNIRVGQGDIYTYATVNSPFQTQLPLRVLAALCHGINLPLFLFALLSFLFIWPKRWHWIASTDQASRTSAISVACLLLYITLVYVTLQAEPRYSIPFRSFEIILAVTSIYGLVNAWRRYKQVHRKSDGVTRPLASHGAR